MGIIFPNLKVSESLGVLKEEFDREEDKQDYVGNLLIEFYEYVDSNPSRNRIEGLLLKIDSLFLYAKEKNIDLTNQKKVYLGLLQEYRLRENGIKNNGRRKC